jgi:hypothetical protein
MKKKTAALGRNMRILSRTPPSHPWTTFDKAIATTNPSSRNVCTEDFQYVDPAMLGNEATTVKAARYVKT